MVRRNALLEIDEYQHARLRVPPTTHPLHLDQPGCVHHTRPDHLTGRATPTQSGRISSLAPRASTHNGSVEYTALTFGGSASVIRQSKSPTAWSHVRTPSVTTMSRVCADRCANHQSTSWRTQCERAASGDASSTKWLETASARSIVGQSS